MAWIAIGAHTESGSLSSATPIGSILAPPANAEGILFQADGDEVRWTNSGATPSATNGFKLADTLCHIIRTTPALPWRVVMRAAHKASGLCPSCEGAGCRLCPRSIR